MEPFYQRLKKSERERNRHTSCMLYTYDAGKTERYTSSLPGVFPDIECCRARYLSSFLCTCINARVFFIMIMKS